ncbi:peptidase C39 family protein, partial [Candidatus Marsarchaeota archaeon]|nr:peptidase C39 family protein [Candidatus Marsarchaeota archaeon]
TVNTVKNTLNNGNIPILLVNANKINPYLDSSPHWVVVKGYDEDSFYVNDPYSDSTIAIEPNALKEAIGYENEYHMIVVKAKK